jgi:phosphoribosylformylglycinamidine synthase
MVAKGDLGAEIALERVHQREPNMNALEILLAESQERICYEVRPGDVDAVRSVAETYDLGCSVIGEVTESRYVCTFEGSEAGTASDEPSGEHGEPRGRETVVDAPAEFLADGAPMNDLDHVEPEQPATDLPDPAPDLRAAFEAVVGAPNTASKAWVYRQYDHEVGTRTALPPGDDAALVAVRESAPVEAAPGTGLAVSAGADPNWTDAAPYDGARAVALENATNIAATGAHPLAAVDCLNGGNPEKPDVYGGFRAVVDGLADGCADLDVPVVGGNVSLYNDSEAGPVPPTPTLAMVGTKAGYDAPPAAFAGEGAVLVVGDRALEGEAVPLGGSEYLVQHDGTDAFPAPPADGTAFVRALADVADHDATRAVHDVSHGGLAVALAEMVTGDAGAEIDLGDGDARRLLFNERVGRAVVETGAPGAVRAAFEGVAPVHEVGTSTSDGVLDLTAGGASLSVDIVDIRGMRSVIGREME